MKKLIYLILFIPFIGFGQTYPHQIEPDTTHRMIMMTDTSVIDSPAMEFLYFSIDSLVEQIARDTLGLDSTYWSLDDSLSLSPVNQTNNIILGSLSGNKSMSGVFNFIAGNQLGQDLTTGDYNSIFGFGVFNSLTSGNYNFGSGYQNFNSTNANYNFGSGYQNFYINTSGYSNFASGYRNYYSNTTGAMNFANGQNNFYNNNGNYNFANGFENYYTATGVGFSFGNGWQNLRTLASGDVNFTSGWRNGYDATSGSYAFLVGGQNLFDAISINSSTAIGYRNGFQTTSAISNFIAIGTENAYNAVNHSNSIYLGYRQGYTTGAANKILIGMAQDDPLIDGSFSADTLRINGTLSIRDKTGTPGNFAAFDGDKIVDSGVSTLGDPDQTLSFSDPDLTISGSGGNTIDISGVNYWDTNADGIYTLDNVGINTTPHATHPFYVVGTMWLDGPVRDGNGNFSGGTGNIMTANSSGEFLWEAPSNIGLASFNNNAGFLTSEVDGSTTNELQTLSISGPTGVLTISSGNNVNLPWKDIGGYVEPRTATDGVSIPADLYDVNGDRGSSGNLLTSTGSAIDWVSKSSINLSDFNNDAGFITSSPWTDNGLYVSTTNNEDVYIAAGESIGLATTIPSSSYQIDGDTDSAVRLRGDLYDKNSDNGSSGDVLMSDGDQIVWVTKGSAQLEDALESTSSTTYVDLNFTSGGSWGITGSTSTDDFSIPYTGVYKLIASGGNSSTGQCVVQFERNGTGIYELNIGTGHDQNNTGTFTPAAFSFHYIASFTVGDDITMAFKAGTNTCVLDDIVFSIETMSVVGGI